MTNPTRVLIVEDSVVQRKILRMALEGNEGVEVIGHASNGKLALERIALGDVDVISLDLEMPVMGGLEVLQNLKGKQPEVGVIVVSALSQQGASATIEAMRLGAFDLITKPTSGGAVSGVIQDLREQLIPRIRACGVYIENRRRSGGRGATSPRAPLPSALENRRSIRSSASSAAPSSPAASSERKPRAARGRFTPEILVLGSSTGGPRALDVVLPALPADLSVPVLVVQHMPPVFTKTLAESLDRKCALHVMEATHGQEVRAGEILIAPGAQQMCFRRQAGKLVVNITDDPPERSCKPSVDYLFRAASEVTRGNTLAVVLTGMGDDGTAGSRLLQPLGARIIAQDEATCVVFGMPRLLVTEDIADKVLPLDKIAGEITLACGRRART